jgi:hypothetical protein
MNHFHANDAILFVGFCMSWGGTNDQYLQGRKMRPRVLAMAEVAETNIAEEAEEMCFIVRDTCDNIN